MSCRRPPQADGKAGHPESGEATCDLVRGDLVVVVQRGILPYRWRTRGEPPCELQKVFDVLDSQLTARRMPGLNRSSEASKAAGRPLPRDRYPGLNRSSEASKVVVRRSYAPPSWVCLNRSSEASKVARRAEARREDAGLNRSSEASKAGGSSTGQQEGFGLNRSSEASKDVATLKSQQVAMRPQSLLRGIERHFPAEMARAEAAASIAPQRHRKGLPAPNVAASGEPQSLLRGIESRRRASRPRSPPAASIAPQRHRKFVTTARPGVLSAASIAPQRHRKWTTST